MIAFYGPKDLREVDPRPTPAPSAADEDVVRDLLATRLTGDDLDRALQALGLQPYVRAMNESGRDAWTRRPTPLISKEAAAGDTYCKNGHPREQFTYINREGVKRCRQCRRISEKNRRAVKAAA